MVRFDRIILPGGEGRIEIKVNIKGKTGLIQKSIGIYNNDVSNNPETLTVKAIIKDSINVSSKSLSFRGEEGTVLTKSIDIIAQEDKPLSIKPGNFSLQDKMTYRIEETEKGKVFKIVFTNLPQPAGRMRGSLKLMTNYDDKPEITITLTGNFTEKTKDNEK
ncbi:MAG: hypothetical protein JW944_10460 [Deltaproteobacteria bacterium]|nr:hypothetical protein [Deltaproteobacteria bacterium]